MRENWPLEELAFLEWQLRWGSQRRANQTPPPDEDWTVWNILAGRGFGKTRVGGEWLGKQAITQPNTRWLVSAPTTADLRGTCFEGESGLLAVIPKRLIVPTKDGNLYNKSQFELTVRCPYHPGQTSLIKGISAEEPERFRGPQFHGGWLDELAAWKYLQMSWDMIMFTMRLGQQPRLICTTTPRPKPLIKLLAEDKLSVKTVSTRGSSRENFANLAPTYRDQLMQYEGTQLGRQEIDGEILDSEEGGIIKRSWFGLWPLHRLALPVFDEIIISLDTAMTEKTFNKKTGDPDYTACTIWGVWHAKPLGSPEAKKGKPGKVNIMLLDVWQDRLGLPGLIERVKKELDSRYGGEEQRPVIRPAFGPRASDGVGRKPDTIIIEDKGSGISLRQMLAEENIHSYAYNPGRADKLARLHSVSHIAHAGILFLIESEENPGKPMKWYEEFLSQVCVFSGAGSTDFDDYVDSFSQAIKYIADSYRITVSKPVENPDDDFADKKTEKPRNPYSS